MPFIPLITARRVRLLATLFAALLALLVVPSAQGATEDFYGINAGSGIWHLAPADRDAQLAKMKAIGLSVVRHDATWGEAEPAAPVAGQHNYRWEGFDDKAGSLARHRLRWYPILCYSAPWASVEPGQIFSTPSQTDFAAFARAFTQRYGRNGDFWREHPELPALPTTTIELWNEPNFSQFWIDQGSAPEVYADLYASARAEMKAIDPNVTAVVGGLIDMDNANEFVRRMYRHRPGLRRNVDAVGFHPYVAAGGPTVAVRSIRRTLDRLGEKRVPIEITEIGWFNGAMAEQERARRMRLLARHLKRSNLRVTRFIPYVWTTSEYALWNMDATPTPSGQAYSEAVQAVTGPQLSTVGLAAVKRVKPRDKTARRSRR